MKFQVGKTYIDRTGDRYLLVGIGTKYLALIKNKGSHNEEVVSRSVKGTLLIHQSSPSRYDLVEEYVPSVVNYTAVYKANKLGSHTELTTGTRNFQKFVKDNSRLDGKIPPDVLGYIKTIIYGDGRVVATFLDFDEELR